jgi:GGDEF domain-containing protein
VNEALLSGWISDHVHRLKRRCDILGHYGPNGFLLLLPHTSESGAVTFCQRLRFSMDQTPPRPPMPAVALLGVSSCADGRATPKSLLRRAEERLDEARTAATVGMVS